MARIGQRQKLSAFQNLKFCGLIIRKNQNLIIDVFENSEENWMMVKAHTLRGWFNLVQIQKKQQKMGLQLVSRLFQKKKIEKFQEIKTKIFGGSEFNKIVEDIEYTYGLKNGDLLANSCLYTHFWIENGNLLKIKNTNFPLSLTSLKLNYAFLKL